MDLIERFFQQLTHLGVSWEWADNPTAARLAVLRYFADSGRKHVLAWRPEALPLPGLKDALADIGISLLSPHRRHLSPEFMLGLTSADAALAQTGSLIFRRAAGQSWLPGLIVLHHLVILPAQRLYPDWPTWSQAHPHEAYDALIVTGPSVSDDIELHPHRGMFGPGRMHVVVFGDGVRNSARA